MLGHRNDIPEIMASLNILAHPSYASEGVPQSVIQGMAMGVPVIASNLKALGEVVKDRETGIIVPIKESKKFAKEIMMLLNDNFLRNKLVSNARKLVIEKFSLKKMIDSIEELYAGIRR